MYATMPTPTKELDEMLEKVLPHINDWMTLYATDLDIIEKEITYDLYGEYDDMENADASVISLHMEYVLNAIQHALGNPYYADAAHVVALARKMREYRPETRTWIANVLMDAFANRKP